MAPPAPSWTGTGSSATTGPDTGDSGGRSMPSTSAGTPRTAWRSWATSASTAPTWSATRRARRGDPARPGRPGRRTVPGAARDGAAGRAERVVRGRGDGPVPGSGDRRTGGRGHLDARGLRSGLPAAPGRRAAGSLRPGRRRRGHVLRPGTARAAGMVVRCRRRRARVTQPALVVLGARSNEVNTTFAQRKASCCSRGCPTPSRSSSPMRRTSCRCRIHAAWPRHLRPSSLGTRCRPLREQLAAREDGEFTRCRGHRACVGSRSSGQSNTWRPR